MSRHDQSIFNGFKTTVNIRFCAGHLACFPLKPFVAHLLPDKLSVEQIVFLGGSREQLQVAFSYSLFRSASDRIVMLKDAKNVHHRILVL